MLEKELRVLYPDPRAEGDCPIEHGLSAYETSNPTSSNKETRTPTRKYLLQLGHTYNSAIPYGPTGPSYIQTTAST